MNGTANEIAVSSIGSSSLRRTNTETIPTTSPMASADEQRVDEVARRAPRR